MAEKHVCAGGIVYRPAGGGSSSGYEVLLMRDRFGQWTLPKGHLEPGESPAVAALREVAEETGVQGEIGELVGQTVYTIQAPNGIEEKLVYFYLVTAAPDAVVKANPAEVQETQWLPLAAAGRRLNYGNMRAVMAVAATHLSGWAPTTQRPAR